MESALQTLFTELRGKEAIQWEIFFNPPLIGDIGALLKLLPYPRPEQPLTGREHLLPSHWSLNMVDTISLTVAEPWQYWDGTSLGGRVWGSVLVAILLEIVNLVYVLFPSLLGDSRENCMCKFLTTTLHNCLRCICREVLLFLLNFKMDKELGEKKMLTISL